MSSSQVQSLLKSFNKWRGLTEAQLADWVGSLHTTVCMSMCFALMLSLPGNRLLIGWEAYCNDTASRTWCLQAGQANRRFQSLSRLWLSSCLSSPHARSRPTSKADFYTIIQCLMVPSLSSSQPWDACSQLNVQSISQYSAVRSVIGSKSSVLCASPYKHIYDILYVHSPTQLLQLCLSPSLNNKQLTDLATQLN